jgi:predicted PurR-regulated permease PerM
MGDVTGMGPAWILLSLSVWGSLLGLVGMIIALPITSLLVSYYKRFVLHISEDMTRKLPPSSWNIPFFKHKRK